MDERLIFLDSHEQPELTPAFKRFIYGACIVLATISGAMGGFEYRDKLQKQHDKRQAEAPRARPSVYQPTFACHDKAEWGRMCRARMKSMRVGK